MTNVDPREKRIGLSVKALRKSEERDEMDAYLRRERARAAASRSRDVMPETAEKSRGS